MPLLTVRYFAGARAAAGVAEERIELAGSVTVHDALAAIGGRHEGRLDAVLPACSFLLDGVAVRDRTQAITDSSAELDVLPPFAGG